ncbi:marine proteobacterial sortase target protein [Sinobacterium caligoides]|nr:marine proteobacterial sortase target protein [Sinobacterium caligoides]
MSIQPANSRLPKQSLILSPVLRAEVPCMFRPMWRTAVWRRQVKLPSIRDNYYVVKRRRSNYLRLAALLVFVLGLLMVAVSHAAESEAGAIKERRIDDVEAGELLLQGADQPGYRPALLLSSAVDFQVNGMVAKVVLKQRFRNSSEQWLEGVYVFPLPDRAAVNYLKATVGDRVIEAEVKEKGEAKAIYQRAKQQGRLAAMTEQQRPNLFTNKIANIAPGETVEVEMHYLQTVGYDSGRFSLRFPMTITPRYIPGAPLPVEKSESHVVIAEPTPLAIDSAVGWAMNTDQVADAQSITPYMAPAIRRDGSVRNPISITASINAGLPLASVDSGYHAIVVKRQENHYQLSLAAGRVAMDRDFELSWQPTVGQAPKAAIFSETLPAARRTGDSDTLSSPQRFISLMLMPPQSQQRLRVPKETVYIIDTSGSMGGESIRQARRSLLLAIDRLAMGDRFNIIEFNSVTRPLFKRSRAVDADSLASARRFVSGLSATGGTEMAPALAYALSKNGGAEGYLRRVVFITDGAVGNEEALLQQIERSLGDNRLFTVAIGSAPNAYFMHKVAQLGRGSFTQVASVDEVDEKMSILFRRLETPLVTDVKLTWPAGVVAESYPQRLPDLYAGQPLLVKSKLSGREFAVHDQLQVSGIVDGKSWRQRIDVSQLGAAESKAGSGISTLWAREKIAELMDAKRRGEDPQEVRERVVDIALNHQLVTKYTSLIAVERHVVRAGDKPLRTAGVANNMPKGSDLVQRQVSYPKTATPMYRQLLFGAALLLLALMIQWWLNKAAAVTRHDSGGV